MKGDIIIYIKKNINNCYIEEAINIINLAYDSELKELSNCIVNDSKSDGQTFYIQLDFIKSRLIYYGELKSNGKFGFDLADIPELVAKWREEKLNKLNE